MVSATGEIRIRPATRDDLDAINTVIAQAMQTWQLPPRVLRLSLPLYRYDASDFRHLGFVLAERAGRITGVAATEPAAGADCPGARGGVLLHGIYVTPDAQREGTGRRLLAAVEAAAGQAGQAGILVKAQHDARAFFEACGYRLLAVRDPDRDYPARYWKPLAAPA